MKNKILIAGLLLLSAFLAILFWKERENAGLDRAEAAAQQKADQQLLLSVSHQKELFRLQTQLGDLAASFKYLRESKTFGAALNDLSWGYDNLNAGKAASFGSSALKKYYADHLFKEISGDRDSILAHWFPKNALAVYLQSFYMAGKNRWDKDHPHHYIPAFFGPDIQASSQMMSAENLWILGPGGNVLYSTGVQNLLGVNLLEDPFATSAAGQLLEEVLSQNKKLVLVQKPNPITGKDNTMLMGGAMGPTKKPTGFLLVQFKPSVILPNLSENILHSFSWEALENQAEGDTLISRMEVEGISLWLKSWRNTLPVSEE